MRQRFQRKLLSIGGIFRDTTIKSLQESVGFKMPSKAYYEDGKPIECKDELVRIVLTNGQITYMKKGSYIIK